MYIFFLLINLIFAFIFFLFTWENKLAFIETSFFFLMWIMMFFYFSPMYFKNKNNEESVISKFSLSKETFKKTIPIFQKMSYLIAFLFFYISLYWISFYYWWSLFSYFILILSLSVILLFFVFYKKQKEIVNLIFRYNFLVFSIIILLSFVYKLILNRDINNIFIINSILSLFWLFSVITLDKIINKQKLEAFYAYSIFYLLLFVFFYVQYYFKFNYYLVISYFWFIFSVFYFDIITKIEYLKQFDGSSKYFWIFLSYLTFIFSSVLLYIYPNFWHFVLIIFWLIIFHYYIYNYFKNYPSILLILLWIALIYTKNYIELNNNSPITFILFIYLLPFLFLWYTFLFENKYEYDYHIIVFFWVAFSILSIIVYYFIIRDFNILNTSIILLLQSFLLFWGFARLRNK